MMHGMAPTPKVTITVRLHPQTYSLLRVAAKARDCSINAYVLHAITTVAAQEIQETQETPR